MSKTRRATQSNTAPHASRRDAKKKEADACPGSAPSRQPARPQTRLTLAALINAVAIVKELRTRAEAEAAAANPPEGTRDPTNSEEEEARSLRED
jgi:hypothetical protein